jgi:haloacetate dehalogenase
VEDANDEFPFECDAAVPGVLARRLALDHPDAVSRLAVLDIIPAETIYATLDQERATTVWRYLFLIQSPELPERLIGVDPGFYLDWTLQEWCGTPGAPTDAAVLEYRRCFDTATVHASCEDYRAGATIDLVHDWADEAGIGCPVLVLWSAGGIGSVTGGQTACATGRGEVSRLGRAALVSAAARRTWAAR